MIGQLITAFCAWIVNFVVTFMKLQDPPKDHHATTKLEECPVKAEIVPRSDFESP